MGVPRFLLHLLRQAPSKRQLLRSLALGSKGGDRTLTSADGTALSARRTGSGDPLVLVHGTLDGIGAFSLVELQLAERHDVWVYDRRGRGGSGDAADHSLDREIEDLRAVVEATGGAPHVVAHSFGAFVALHAAAAGTPMRSLTVYEPPLNPEGVPEERIEQIRSAVDAGCTDEAIRTMAIGLAGVSEEEMAIALAVPPVRDRLRDGVRPAPRELETIRAIGWPSTGLPLSDRPVLVLRGSRVSSEVYPRPDQVADIAVDVAVATFEGQGHLAHIFAPSRFATEVLGFLARH